MDGADLQRPPQACQRRHLQLDIAQRPTNVQGALGGADLVCWVGVERRVPERHPTRGSLVNVKASDGSAAHAQTVRLARMSRTGAVAPLSAYAAEADGVARAAR